MPSEPARSAPDPHTDFLRRLRAELIELSVDLDLRKLDRIIRLVSNQPGVER